MHFQRLEGAVGHGHGRRADIAAGLDVLDIGQGHGTHLGLGRQLDADILPTVDVHPHHVAADPGDFPAYANAHARRILGQGRGAAQQERQGQALKVAQQTRQRPIHGTDSSR
ncbi:hypothetical protein BME99_08960 [Pseudomonas protegens]|nr:hypothetical protein BME99_08960 [Pseudomonas protegens]